jgi:hypothetical protein
VPSGQTTPARLFFYDASCLDVIIPGVFRVAVDNVSVWLDLKISSGVFDVWRVMDFGRRSGPDKPKAQTFEDGADNRRVLNAADDPHFPLTLWADHRICLIYLLDQSCLAFSKCLHVPLWFKDAGDSIIAAFLLPFSPRDITVKAVVFYHFLAPVGDVRTHGGQPFHHWEALGCLAAFGSINDCSLLIQVLHAFLGKRRPDDIARQVFHSSFISGRDAVSAEDVKPCMQIFVTAVITFDAGKAVVRVAAIEKTIDHLFDIGPPEAVLP